MAEQVNPPELLLKQLISSYPFLTDTSPSSWFVWSDNDGLPPVIRVQSVCHADMRFHKTGYDHLVTAVPKHDKLSIKFIRMLIAGPFRAFSDTISLRKSKGSYYLQVDQLGLWPANVLFNFIIASRVPVEYEHFFGRWAELMQMGYPSDLAFLMSYSTDGKAFKGTRQFPNANHLWLDPASDWKRILSGTPDMSMRSFKDMPGGITPTNVVWSKSTDYHTTSLLPDDKLAEFFGFKLPEKPKPRKKVELDFDKQALIYKKFVQANHGLAAQQMAQMVNQIHAGAVEPGHFAPQLHDAPQPPQPAQWNPNLHWHDHVDPPVVAADPEPPIEDDDNFDDFPDFEDDD